MRRTTGSEGSITVEELFDTGSLEFTSGEFVKRIQTNQFAVENLVSEDFRFSALLVQTEPMEDVVNTQFYFALKSVIETKSTEAFALKLVGLPALIAQMDQDTQKNIGAITMAALFGDVDCLVNTFPILVGNRWTSLGRYYWVNLVVRVHGMDRCHDELRERYYSRFLIIVGLADAIHLQSSYASKLSILDSPREALAAAIAKTALPIAFTSFTTMVGLMSFRTASVEAVRELGFSGSIGILGAMVSTLMLLPFFLRLDRKGKMVSKET